MKPIERALLSLDGLSVGDALGERFFGNSAFILPMIEQRKLPPPVWEYTDDTEMAISIVETLHRYGRIDPDTLADLFSRRYNPMRGYGGGAHRLLQSYKAGADWRVEAVNLFGGSGSYGNGSAMRIAPLGAYFADDMDAARENAIISAKPTHAHAEAEAGAVAVAIGAALAWQSGEGTKISSREFLEIIIDYVPESETRTGILKALDFSNNESPQKAAGILGSGQRVSSQDTVPFVLWCASNHLDNYVEAFWTTVSGLGDRDTTCAMVGGIVALSDRKNGIPAEWLKAREGLPAVFPDRF